MEEHNKPVDTIRLGTIKAAIWQNETETGPRYSATFERLYKDGDQWKRNRTSAETIFCSWSKSPI